MKLYTEEQVMKAYNTGIQDEYNGMYKEDIVALKLIPIELPSYDDIQKETKNFKFEKNKEIFYNGAKWMKEQILNQNK